MKSPLVLQQFKKCIILFMVGIISSALAYVLYVINPMELILNSMLTMKPNSLVFSLWQKPPIDVYLKVYIFNITNAEEFLKGGVPLKVAEVGPYVYKEDLENTNVTWHEDNTISFYPKRTITFVPEMSIANPEMDVVYVPNVPFLGVTSTLHDAGFLVNFPLARLTGLLNTKPILNITVHEYLWGHEDSLISLASGIVPNFINFRKFGLLDRMYDEGNNKVRLNIKRKKDMLNEEGRYLSIESFNNQHGLSQWGYREPEGNETYPENTICNRLRGCVEGTLFPPFLDPRAKFRVFRKSFCRPIPIEFKEKVWLEEGFEGYLYTTSKDFLDSAAENPDNKCYCRNPKKCLRRGLSDMTPCYYNIPAAMSLPHFLNADPDLSWNIVGLKPDPEQHEARIILQPSIGIPVRVNSRIQINLVMYPTIYNSKVQPFNDMTVPLFWTDLYIPELTGHLMFIVKMILIVGPMIFTVVTCLLGIAGVTCLVLSLATTMWVINQQPDEQNLQRKDSADLRIPLSHGHYTTIRILPSINKITSKTDLFMK